MKAIRFDQFGGPEQLVLRDVPTPHCGPHDVLIDVHAASVTPGDWKLRAGLLQSVFPVSLPCIPGRDGAGIIIQIGDQVDYAQVGDAVCFVADRVQQGSYASRIVRAADHIAPMPTGFSYAEAAALVHAAMCAWIMLVEYARIRPGQHVLVQAGSGAVGGMAIQLARHIGATVTTTCRATNAEYVRELGAHHVIAYDQENFAEGFGNMDVVLDLIGGEVREQSRRALKPDGILVWLVGLPVAPRVSKDGVNQHEVQAVIHDRVEVLQAVTQLANQGVLQPQISAVLPLDQAANAHARVQSGQHGRGRIILDIHGCAHDIP
ncbi:NADP-dependent oxidoreductase [Alcaligenaceae bacterium CGII-47]|nr:NADP-dependent oxidoreductase [Alcaligenaceae bacterium CGII-47]